MYQEIGKQELIGLKCKCFQCFSAIGSKYDSLLAASLGELEDVHTVMITSPDQNIHCAHHQIPHMLARDQAYSGTLQICLDSIFLGYAQTDMQQLFPYQFTGGFYCVQTFASQVWERRESALPTDLSDLLARPAPVSGREDLTSKASYHGT